MAARFGNLMSTDALAQECDGILNDRGGHYDFALRKGRTYVGYCLDDLMFKEKTVYRRRCTPVGF